MQFLLWTYRIFWNWATPLRNNSFTLISRVEASIHTMEKRRRILPDFVQKKKKLDIIKKRPRRAVADCRKTLSWEHKALKRGVFNGEWKIENGKWLNPFSVEKAIETAAFGRKSNQNAQHFFPLILHSAFSILHWNSLWI